MASRSGKHFRVAPHIRRLHVEPLEDRRMLAVATVDTELDIVDLTDGVTSLREAIFATNTLAGADTIEFNAPLAGKTILLTHGELEITDDLTINGLGANSLTIDAQQQSRIFNVTSAEGNLEINALTLARGRTMGDNSSKTDTTFNGGAIRFIVATMGQKPSPSGESFRFLY